MRNEHTLSHTNDNVMSINIQLRAIVRTLTGNKGVFSSLNFLALTTLTLFVCIYQLVSNHRLIRLKRFVS
jgi:hypothetical protein